MDALPPGDIAAKAETAGVTKAGLGTTGMFLLAVMAGVFIALGSCMFTTVVTGSTLGYGLTRAIGALTFCVGLILVVVAGAELFTGNCLMTVAVLSRRITIGQLLRNWVIVYAGNFVGSLLIAYLVFAAAQWRGSDMAVGQTAYTIAGRKMSLSFGTALASGILCNALVCLAVWMCYGARSVADKVLAIVFPITAFVTMGFEHSVANMYFIPYGILLARSGELTASPIMAETIARYPTAGFTAKHFLMSNLLPVTLGNVVGGVAFVGIAYWVIFRRNGDTDASPASIESRLEEFSNR